MSEMQSPNLVIVKSTKRLLPKGLLDEMYKTKNDSELR